MISKVRSRVQQTRQQFRDDLPGHLAEQFSRPVTKAEWTAMFKGLGKTDLAVFDTQGVTDALRMLADDRRLNAGIQGLERSIQAAEGTRAPRIQAKAKQLANYMLTGEHGDNLLRNARAVAHLFEEQGFARKQVSDQLIAEVDQLTTLYAVQSLDQDTKTMLRDLIQAEPDGMEFVLSYLVGQRRDELAKTVNGPARLNHYKGYIPSEAEQGGSLVIDSDKNHATRLAKGYVWVANYQGSSADRTLTGRSYYFSPVSGRAPFRQGIMQTVHQTASGVDPQTGYTLGEVMAGRIVDYRQVQLTKNQLRNQKATSENLLPVFDGDGNVIAYERAADPARLEVLNRNTDLAKMIGVWRGRQFEERYAQEVNEVLIDNLWDIWERDSKRGRANEFVNLASDKLDPVIEEAVRLIPNQARDYIREVFGDRFMVRRDMLLDVLGDRQASVGDLFTGQTRWKPYVAQEFEKIAFGIFGNKAYNGAVNIERFIQDVVANAKELIVVKSVIVPVANMLSNTVQLINRGVPVRHVLRGAARKTTEINAFVRSRAREVRLEAELRAAEGKNDLVAMRRLNNELTSIRDSYRRMSIWPLIAAGEFSAISQGQPTVEDLAIADGKWTQWVEKRIPPHVEVFL